MKGIYVLVIKLKNNSKIRVGKLGVIDFSRGYYCYVGSALGKAVNLENRIGRHKKLSMEKSGKLKWHIDYFLVDPNSSIVDVIIIKGGKRIECEISKKIERVAEKSISGFGCSDCGCRSHLHYFSNRLNWERILEGIDVVDGTPLLDIKLHVPKFDGRKNINNWLSER